MTTYFQDLQDGELFLAGGTRYVKGRHPFYTTYNVNEIAPNAYRPDAPHLYVRFGPVAPVIRIKQAAADGPS